MSFEVDVRRRLGETVVATRFAAADGLTALYGPSGVGKSSVLNMIAGLLRPDSGRIAIEGTVLFDSARGVDIPPERRRIGYVFQDGRLFPHLSVRANLLYGARLDETAEAAMTLDEAVGVLGVGHLLERRPRTLSGGEARRIAIGRALLRGPRVLLMDEPLSGVDPARREEILALIERLRDRLGLPILYVSHDRGEVERLAGTVVEMTPGA